MIQNKPVIGILPTYNLTNKENDPYQDRASFVRMYIEKITECGGIPIGLLEENISIYKDICDGYLWPGGTRVWPKFNTVFEDILEKNKPLLGVCLGSQTIATYFNVLEDKGKSNLSFEEVYQREKKKNPYLVPAEKKAIHEHYVTKDEGSIEAARHRISIKKESILYQIYGKEKMEVVSLHGMIIHRTPKSLMVSATSEDGVVEAIEYKDYILGVQFHPEIEKYSNIFDWLVKTSQKNVLKRTKE